VITKRRVYEILEGAREEDRTSRVVNVCLLVLIVLSVLALIVETVEHVGSRHASWFWVFEVFSVAVFTLEYLLRVWSCTEDPERSHPVWGRLRMMARPVMIIDLLAILPFYLPLVMAMDGRALRAFRLLRFFRIFKLGRYSQSLQLVGTVLREKTPELMVILLAVIIMLVITSSLMYFVEHEAQPDAFASIPATMWWGVATLTTVGYGDIYPITPLGKVLGAAIAMMGIGLFALPTGVMAAAFAEEVSRIKQEARDKQAKKSHSGDREP